MNRAFIHLGPITIYWYSVMILLGILVAYLVIIKEAKREKMKDYIDNLIFYVIIIGIIGARLYYVLFYEGKYTIIDIFKIWEGGLAIYGGVIAGFLAVLYFAKKHQQDLLKTTDILAPGLIIGQAIGRWGNFFNQEAYGTEVSLVFLKKMHIPNFIIEGMYIDSVYHHPTFLYESLASLVGFIILLIIRKVFKRKKGLVTYSYFIWYGMFRFLIEGLRTDSLYIGIFRVSQIVSIILIIIGLIGIINIVRKRGKDDGSK